MSHESIAYITEGDNSLGLTKKHMDFILVALSLSLLGNLVMPVIHFNFIKYKRVVNLNIRNIFHCVTILS